MALVTISRQFGAGGHTLGMTVADHLNYQLVDREIINEIAKEANVSVEWVQAMEREAGGLLMRMVHQLVSSSFIERMTGGPDFDPDKYLKFLKKVILQMAEKDDIVFVGRGSQFVLAEHPAAIKILLVAKMPDRIRFMTEFYDLSPEKAEQWIRREEKRRSQFLARFYDGDPDAPDLYDMVINMSRVELTEAETLIVDAVKRIIDETARPIW
jgi:cytidylate kinase